MRARPREFQCAKEGEKMEKDEEVEKPEVTQKDPSTLFQLAVTPTPSPLFQLVVREVEEKEWTIEEMENMGYNCSWCYRREKNLK